MNPPETEEGARPDGKSTEQPEPQELPRQNVDVALIAFLPLPHSDDRDDDLASLDQVDDAVPLTGGANTAEAIQLTDQRLALLLARLRKLPGALVNGAFHTLASDRLFELERWLRPPHRVDRLGHRPRPFLPSP